MQLDILLILRILHCLTYSVMILSVNVFFILYFLTFSHNCEFLQNSTELYFKPATKLLMPTHAEYS